MHSLPGLASLLPGKCHLIVSQCGDGSYGTEGDVQVRKSPPAEPLHFVLCGLQKAVLTWSVAQGPPQPSEARQSACGHSNFGFAPAAERRHSEAHGRKP